MEIENLGVGMEGIDKDFELGSLGFVVSGIVLAVLGVE